MKRNSELKKQASGALEGSWGAAALITLVAALIVSVPDLPSRLSQSDGASAWGILSLLLLPLSYGYAVLFLGAVRGVKPDFARLFDGFKDYGRILGTLLLMKVYTVLWALLLLVPGVVKSYSYSMTEFILKDHPELAYNAAIERSMAMMSGYKMKLFLMDLSFIGWAILSLCTLGIGFLFLAPYATASHAAFYEELKLERAAAGTDEPR